MKTLTILLAFLTYFGIQSFSQTWQWTHPEPNGVEVTSYPDPYTTEDDKVHDVETDAAGNIYVLGNFMDSLYLSNNFIIKKNGSYLAKYDSTGTLLWYRLIRPTSASTDNPYIYATDLTVNTTGVYITGKYAPSSYYYDCSISVANAVRSYRIGALDFTSSGRDMGFFLTKFNANGTVIWNKTATDPIVCVEGSAVWTSMSPYNPVVTSDNAGNVVCGFVAVVHQKKNYIQINSDLIQLNGSNADYINPQYLVVAKYNSAGALQWSANAGGGFNTINSGGGAYQGQMLDCNSLISDKNNNIFFHGAASDSTFFGSQLFRTNASQATFFAKISSAGAWQFAKELSNTTDGYLHFGGVGNGENPERLAVDTSNNVYAIVDFSGNPQEILGATVSTGGVTSCYLVKIKNSGALTWIKSFGSTRANSVSNSIHINNNSLYICGSNPAAYYGDEKYVFSSLYVPTVGGFVDNHFYAAKADLNGNFIWVTTFEDGGYSAYGTAIKAFNGNIYIGGEYAYKITSLGNLNGSFTNTNPGIGNLFLGKLKDQYIKVGAVAPTQIIPGCTITVPFASTGLTFTAGNSFTAELSNSYGDFTTPTAIGSTISTGTGTITATIPASLTYTSGYRIRIHSSDTLKTGLGYYAYADTPYVLSLVCAAPSSGFAATNIAATSATLNWTAVGCASGYKVQYRVKGTTVWTTTPVITTNTPALNIAGLTANTTYQWRVATRCKNNGVFSYSAFTSAKQFTTAASFEANNSNADNIVVQNKNILIRVYPNPANNDAVVAFTAGKSAKYTIEFTDVSGKILQTKNMIASIGENKVLFDLSKYAQGMYIINVTDDEHGKRTLKLNKE